MMFDRHTSNQPLRWLIVVALLAALTLALISQFPRSERSADDSFNTVVFQKKIYDEGGNPDSTDSPVETNPFLDAFLTSAVFVCAVVFKSAFATVRQVAISFLIFFLSASPRAPPALPSL